MQKRTLVEELSGFSGETKTISGWLYKRRLLGSLNFLIIRDRSGLVQILVEDKKELEKLHGLQLGSVLEITGDVTSDERAPSGVEIHNPKIIVKLPVTDVMPIEIDKPISHKPEHLDTLFENRVVALRNIHEQAIFKVQAGIENIIRTHLLSKEFVSIHSPKLLAEATEGGAEVFKLDYFGKEATLAQSAQFYKQIMVGVFERVFEIGSTYRAEPSTTTRHMSEYITVDVEMGFIESFADVKNLLNELIWDINENIWVSHESELNNLRATKSKITKKIPEITLKELHQEFYKQTKVDTRNEKDPTPAEERFASEYSLKKYGSEAIYITEFPTAEMKFYHHINDSNPEVCDRADLIFRGVEIVTITQRENRYDVLVDQLKSLVGVDPDHPGFKYYLDAFKYGMPNHGGFGLGLERLTAKIIGLNNVKEATLFPRDMQRLAP
ncbi:MAG: nondiscriminating aspartyl-tRNA synthetase [Patescibacteria group bacterium]|jgi:nondiscriminating aspartyl-tRNA synthetase|nr:nondiscriminating aspartyl-tRNA synthetase [Patescibacteria group bacterium]